jgi:hypothetical protein
MHANVELWPQYSVLHDYEARIGWPAVQASAEEHGAMVDLIPGAAEALARAALPEGAWERCRDAERLAAAVEGVRRRQRAWWSGHRRRRGQQQQERDEDAEAAAAAGELDQFKDWLPWTYDVIGVGGVEAAEMLEDESCGFWLLKAGAVDGVGDDDGGSGSNNSSGSAGTEQKQQADDEFEAVVVLSHSKLFRRQCAGILAASPAHIAPCIARAAAAGPHFICFIDQGAHYWGPVEEGADRGAWPPLYRDVHAPSSSYYVYAKPMEDADGGPDGAGA